MLGAGRAAQVRLVQARLVQVRLTQVRHAQVRLAQVVGPVAVIPQWISKMQVERRGREVPSIEPDSRRARWCANKYWGRAAGNDRSSWTFVDRRVREGAAFDLPLNLAAPAPTGAVPLWW